MITPEERAVLDGCYRCVCSGCARRRELIAKVLGELDRCDDCILRLTTEVKAEREAHAAVVKRLRAVLDEAGISADVDEGRDPLDAARSLRRDLNAAQDRVLELERAAMENPLTVEAIRAGVFEALSPPSNELAGFTCLPGKPGYCDGCPICQPEPPPAPSERTPVRSYASEEDWYNDGCPRGAVIRSTP